MLKVQIKQLDSQLNKIKINTKYYYFKKKQYLQTDKAGKV